MSNYIHPWNLFHEQKDIFCCFFVRAGSGNVGQIGDAIYYAWDKTGRTTATGPNKQSNSTLLFYVCAVMHACVWNSPRYHIQCSESEKLFTDDDNNGTVRAREKCLLWENPIYFEKTRIIKACLHSFATLFYDMIGYVGRKMNSLRYTRSMYIFCNFCRITGSYHNKSFAPVHFRTCILKRRFQVYILAVACIIYMHVVFFPTNIWFYLNTTVLSGRGICEKVPVEEINLA